MRKVCGCEFRLHSGAEKTSLTYKYDAAFFLPLSTVWTVARQMPKNRIKHGKILTKTYETVITIHKGETMWT